MIGLIRITLRFAWLTVMILGARRLVQIAQEGVNDLIDNVEEGEAGTVAGVLVRLHDALHRRQERRHSTWAPSGDGIGQQASPVAS